MGPGAAEARLRLADRLRSRFKKGNWRTFSDRLEAHFETLFRQLHALYGWRYDFAWILDEVMDAVATGYQQRPRRLRRLDRHAPAGVQPWVDDQKTIWAMAYLDRFAGTIAGLEGRLDHLHNLGVTHLHLMPPYQVPPGNHDGGYAVSDYRRLRPDLGTMEELIEMVKTLRHHGIGLVLDLICNHTAADHPWARAAAAGDTKYSGFYFIYPDRTVPDQYAPHLRGIFPDRGGDAFTWHPEVQGGSWVWTTFYPFQWDLNYQNPAVLAAMCGEMLFLANLGVAAIRMDATPFLWKQPGTSCENLPEAHRVLAIMRTVADIAAPSVEFLSEAIVHPDDVARYVNPAECRLGYNPLLMSSVWEALATRDTRLLRIALSQRFSLPPECSWLTYLRSHDDIGWGFADEDAHQIGVDPAAHRAYLNAYYSGEVEGSCSRGAIFQANPQTGDARISGTLASLAGLEAAVEAMDPGLTDLAIRRILAAFSVVLAAGGIPLIFMGDTIATLNDHSYLADSISAGDNRWMHRPPFDPHRQERAAQGVGPEGAVYQGILRLLQNRRQLDDVHPTVPPVVVDPGDLGVVAFRRGGYLFVTNLTDRPAIIDRPSLGLGALTDLDSGDTWDGPVLGPYEYHWLATANPGFGA